MWLRPAPAQGLVLRQRSPLGAVESESFGAGPPQVDVTVGADSRFATTALSAGRWEVLWRPGEGGAAPPRDVELPDRERVELQLDFASAGIAGRVVGDDGERVAGARVELLGERGTARTGGDGSFAFADLPAGGHRLEARDEGRRSAVTAVEVPPGRQVEDMVLVLDRAATERLRVRVRIGDAPAGGGLVVVTGDGGQVGLGSLDASGTAELDWSPAWPARVRAAAVVGGRLVLGGWVGGSEAASEGLVLTGVATGALEVSAPRGRRDHRRSVRLGRLLGPRPGRPVDDGLAAAHPAPGRAAGRSLPAHRGRRLAGRRRGGERTARWDLDR